MFAAVLLAALAFATAGRAQTPSPRPPAIRPGLTLPPVLIANTLDVGVRSQRPIAPLPPALASRVRRATDLRLAGLTERARDSLLALQREVPHHPVIVTELARALLAREEFAQVEKLARLERNAFRDSLLLAREFAAALERTGKPRDAMAVIVEAWQTAPSEADWAMRELLRLAPTDARAARDLLRGAAERLPARADLVRGRVLLLSRQGQAAEAARVLTALSEPGRPAALPLQLAEELAASGVTTDSLTALETWWAMAADPRFAAELRVSAARRAWQTSEAHGGLDASLRAYRALRTVPAEQWGGDLLVAVVRSLREAGMTAEARELAGPDRALAQRIPDLALEQALSDLRDGPPERALAPLRELVGRHADAEFQLAEALFFCGQIDSAKAVYDRVGAESSDRTAPALERIYLIEEEPASDLIRQVGRLEYESWRGNLARAGAMADSLWRASTRRSALWAHLALRAAESRARAGDRRAALLPLLAVADSLPRDRLAPLARQRAGDLWLALEQPGKALEQYEECLARYPRAWNAPEVRRRVEQLRRERRF